MANKKKVDVADIKQTHGAVLTQRSVLDRIAVAPSKYGTSDTEVYKKQIENMSLADLQYHSINVAQIRPGYDRNRLVASLLRRFNENLFNEKLKTL